MMETALNFEIKGKLLITQCWCSSRSKREIADMVGDSSLEDDIWVDIVVDMSVIKAIKPTDIPICEDCTVIYCQNFNDFTINVPYEKFKQVYLNFKIKEIENG